MTGDHRKKKDRPEQTCYRWRKEYGGLRMDQARRFKQLERESGRVHGLHRLDGGLDVAVE